MNYQLWHLDTGQTLSFYFQTFEFDLEAWENEDFFLMLQYTHRLLG